VRISPQPLSRADADFYAALTARLSRQVERPDGPEVEAARKGADPHRTIDGEDPSAHSPFVVSQWLKAYSELLELESDLLDLLAARLPLLSDEARREAEDTNLPVIVSQLERFRHRRNFWRKRKDQLEIQ
jgi:hypothetical protein